MGKSYARLILRKVLPKNLYIITKKIVLETKYFFHNLVRFFFIIKTNPVKYRFINDYNSAKSVIVQNDIIYSQFLDFISAFKIIKKDSIYNFYILENVVFFESEWFIKDYNSLIIDSRVKRTSFLKTLNHKQIIFNLKYKFFDYSIVYDLENAVLLNTETNNYYHFTFDVLLKLIIIKKHFNLTKNIIILKPKTHFQIEILSLFKGDFNFFYADSSNSYRVKNATVVEYCNELNGLETISKYNIQLLRKFILEKFKFNKNLNSTKIYIKRNSNFGRNLINHSEFEKYLKSKGFLIIEMEKYSVLEQYEFFYNAKLIIAIHGAALTNLLASKSGIKLIEIQHKNRASRYFHDLAKLIKIDYHSYIDDSDSNDLDPNIVVKLENFISRFESLISNLW